MKKVYDKTKDEFISLKVQDMTLKMEDTINTMTDIIEDLEACRPHLYGHKLNMTNNLIQKAIELRDEYTEIKADMNQPNQNQESLEAIEKRLDRFIIKLNNELSVRVRQLKSKIKGEFPGHIN
jgi:uncharacterized coiled-coil DUF342 family protein